MSLILDALNRSRRDAEPVPGLATEHSVDLKSGGMGQYFPWVVVFLALVVVAWLLFDRFKSTGVETSSQPETLPVAQLSRNVSDALTSVKDELNSQAQQSATQVVAPTADQSPVEPAPEPPPQKVAAIENLAGKVQGEPGEQATVADAKPQGKVTSATEEAVADLYRNKGKEVVSGPGRADSTEAAAGDAAAGEEEEVEAAEEQVIDIARMLEMVGEEMGSPELVEHSAPLLSGLSQQTKDGIPTIMYQRHDYSNRGGVSSVTINGKNLRVGATASGFKVQEILPNSVVLDYRGTVFRLRALNSWVNL